MLVLSTLVAAVAVGITVRVATACTDCELAVRVAGNRLVDARGAPIRLLGVNRSGTEYACVKNQGFFAGPAGPRAIAAMTSWQINAVRIPLNEDCWLGINGAPPRYSGARYRTAIQAYVSRLHRAHLYVILDMHWNAPGGELAAGQRPMADLSHAPAFWASVARTFKADPAVMFDLYNEPNGISWTCWRNGCELPQGWRTAGMQTLLDAIRGTGARQPLIATGLGWGNDLSGWLRYRPRDPARQLVAGFHVYSSRSCQAANCWNRTVRPVALAVPVVTTEFGAQGCSAAFVNSFMSWADSAGVSYLGWCWNPFGCRAPALIRTWSGQPTAYGEGLRAHLLRLHSRRG
jgi:endoglucanase